MQKSSWLSAFLSSYPIVNSTLTSGSQILFLKVIFPCLRCWLQIDLAALPLEQIMQHNSMSTKRKVDDTCGSTGDPQDGCAFGDLG